MTYQTAAELRRANLRTLVAERGGQRELADLVGVAPAQISQWATAARSWVSRSRSTHSPAGTSCVPAAQRVKRFSRT